MSNRQHREFSLGDIVYRWRPAESKLCPSWDGPWEIVRFLGKTRVILRLLKDTRIEGYESVINSKKASRYGSEVDAMVDYWMECSRCGKWRMTTKEDCEKYAAVDDVCCQDLHSSCEAPCDWTMLQVVGDNEQGDRSVSQVGALPKPSKIQVNNYSTILSKSMIGHGVLIVSGLSNDEVGFSLTHILGVVEEVDECQFSAVINTGDDLVTALISPQM